MRYEKTDCAIMVPLCGPSGAALSEIGAVSAAFDYRAKFEEVYMREFGFVVPGRRLIVDDVRIRGVGKTIQGPLRSSRGLSDSDPVVRY